MRTSMELCQMLSEVERGAVTHLNCKRNLNWLWVDCSAEFGLAPRVRSLSFVEFSKV